MKHKTILVSLVMMSSIAFADVTVNMNLTAPNGTGRAVGTITLADTANGLHNTPQLKELPPGLHGFHLHQTPSCDNNGMAAGGHFDPNKTTKHLGPYTTQGHAGDLPALYVDKEGNANLPVLAPHLKESDLKDHAIMIHAGGDNYSDVPTTLGGGGARMVCGVVK